MVAPRTAGRIMNHVDGVEPTRPPQPACQLITPRTSAAPAALCGACIPSLRSDSNPTGSRRSAAAWVTSAPGRLLAAASSGSSTPLRIGQVSTPSRVRARGLRGGEGSSWPVTHLPHLTFTVQARRRTSKLICSRRCLAEGTPPGSVCLTLLRILARNGRRWGRPPSA